MRRSDLQQILETAGFPVAFSRHRKPPGLPYVVFVRVHTPNFFADNKTYKKKGAWHVILVTKWKDESAEALIEAVLDGAGIAYDVADEYEVTEEAVYQVIYEFEDWRD